MIVYDTHVQDTDSFESIDLFGRKAVADGLTAILSRSSQPTVIMLDGDWGTGKTVFLKLWKNELRSAGYPVIYLDAYARDHNSDPIFVIASEVISELEKTDIAAAERFKDRAARVIRSLAGVATSVGVKAITAGLISARDLGEAAEAALTEVGEHATAAIAEALEAGAKHEQSLTNLKQELRGLPEKLKGDNAKSLIFIIDELDRCRPEFSLRLLEIVKHFFDVDNVKFVIGANSRALGASVRHFYGDIDGERYLSRMVNHKFSLPPIAYSSS